jgi:translation initiation factor 2 gamma subunit (eIF-2gamma)
MQATQDFTPTGARKTSALREDRDILELQPTLNIGAIGHVAHGKSTIVKTLTGTQTAKSTEELKKSTPHAYSFQSFKNNI